MGIREAAGNSAMHALLVVEARDKERHRPHIGDALQYEKFTLYDIQECPGDDEIAKIAREYYANYGFTEIPTAESWYRFSHLDGRKINLILTYSRQWIDRATGKEIGMLSVTSALYENFSRPKTENNPTPSPP